MGATRRERTLNKGNFPRDYDPTLTPHFVDDLYDLSKWNVTVGGGGSVVLLDGASGPGRGNGWARLEAPPGGFARLVTKVPVGATGSDPMTLFRMIGSFVPGLGPEISGNDVCSGLVMGLTPDPAPPYGGPGFLWMAPDGFGLVPSQWHLFSYLAGFPGDTTVEGISEDCDNPDHAGALISNRAGAPFPGQGPGNGPIIRTSAVFDPTNPRGEAVVPPSDFDPGAVSNSAYYLVIEVGSPVPAIKFFAPPAAPATRNIAFDLDLAEVLCERRCLPLNPLPPI